MLTAGVLRVSLVLLWLTSTVFGSFGIAYLYLVGFGANLDLRGHNAIMASANLSVAIAIHFARKWALS